MDIRLGKILPKAYTNDGEILKLEEHKIRFFVCFVFDFYLLCVATFLPPWKVFPLAK